MQHAARYVKRGARRRLNKRRQAQRARREVAYRNEVIQLVADSGTVDREFWQLQAGQLATDDADCANLWFSQTTPRGLVSLLGIPGIDIPGAPVDRANPNSGPVTRQEPLIMYLEDRGEAPDFPFFDVDQYRADHPEAAEHPGRELGHFLAHARPDTNVPVPAHWVGPAPSWGPWRESMLDFARQKPPLRGGPELHRMRFEWDHARNQRLIEEANQTAIDVPDGTPLVSVIMPARNRASVIGAAIQSIQAQSLSAWELIVIDDGSTDDTVAVVRSLAQTDQRIKLVTQDWQGASVARNAGLAAATGEFVTFLDTDDQWTPDYLRVSLATLERDKLDAVYLAVEITRNEGVSYRAFAGGLRELLDQNFITMSTLTVRRSLVERVGGFDPQIRRWIDYDFAIRVFAATQPRMVEVVGLLHDDRHARTDRITTSEPDYWEYVVRSKYILDWPELKRNVDQRVPGRVSVVMPTFFDWRMTVEAVQAVFDTCADRDVEVVIVENSANRHFEFILHGLFATNPNVRVVTVPTRLGFALGSNYGFAHSTGEFVLFLNNDTVASDGWLEPLIDALQDETVGAAQPLLTYPDGTIQAAGTVVPNCHGLPTHFLVDHPVEDALKLGPRQFSIGTAAALLMRARDVIELEGFDVRYINGWEDVDLCLRLLEHRPAGVVVHPSSRVTHKESKTPGRGRYIGLNRQTFAQRWEGRMPTPDADDHYRAAGFDVARWASGPPAAVGALRSPLPVLTLAKARLAVNEAVPSLRWAIKIAAHAGPRGDHWGDVFFADELARSLRKLNQFVAVDRRDAHDRRTADLDEVVLNIRGLDTYSPQPASTNVIWVISHPDDVTAAELDSYDLSFAASLSWSDQMSRMTRKPVSPLLQATNADQFHPDAGANSRHRALFIGSSRGQQREIIQAAIAAGVPLDIYGPDWDGQPAADFVRGTFVPRDDVARHYANSDLVLCDHWPDMARNGFISNRIFDAVAAGAVVVSDPVEGIEEIFGDCVIQYSRPEQIAAALDAGRPTDWHVTSQRVREEHSFDVRAQALLDAVLKVR